MNDHTQLSFLIKKAAKTYLRQAGPCGKLLKDFNKAFEKILIDTTLSYYKNNLSTSAKALGISRTTLYQKIKQHSQ